MTPDLINGGFEAAGAASLALNVKRLFRDKKVMGAHWVPTAFFTAWGAWNLYYYPALGQWISFSGGCAIMAVNIVWLSALIYFSARKS